MIQLIGRGLVGLLRGATGIATKVFRGTAKLVGKAATRLYTGAARVAAKAATEAYLGASEAYKSYKLDKRFSNVPLDKREEMERIMNEYHKLNIHDFEYSHSNLHPLHPEFKKSYLTKIAESYTPLLSRIKQKDSDSLYKMENFNHALNLIDIMRDEGAINEKSYRKMKKKLYKKVKQNLKRAA